MAKKISDMLDPEKLEQADLKLYLYTAIEWLADSTSEIENLINDGKREPLNRFNNRETEYDHAELARAYRHYELKLGTTFRYTLLVGVCSYLEDALYQIGAHLDPEFKKRVEDDKRRADFDAQLRVLGKFEGSPIATIDADAQRFRNFLELRRLIVHRWGKIPADGKNRERFRQAIQRVEGATLLQDDRLLLDDQVVIDAHLTAERIVRPMANAHLAGPEWT